MFFGKVNEGSEFQGSVHFIMSKYVHKVQSFLASVHNSVLVAVSFHFHISDLSIIHCIKEHLHVEQSHVEIKQGKLIRSRHCSLMNVVH